MFNVPIATHWCLGAHQHRFEDTESETLHQSHKHVNSTSRADVWVEHAVHQRLYEPCQRHCGVTINITVLSVMQVILMLKGSTIGWAWVMLIAMALRLIAMFERTSMPKHNVYAQQKPWRTPCVIIQISSIKHCHYITLGYNYSNIQCSARDSLMFGSTSTSVWRHGIWNTSSVTQTCEWNMLCIIVFANPDGATTGSLPT